MAVITTLSPGTKFNAFVTPASVDGPLAQRYFHMRHLQIKNGEQRAQIEVICVFYEALRLMEEYKLDNAIFSEAYNKKWRELNGILYTAKSIWNTRQPSIMSRGLSLVRSISCGKRKTGIDTDCSNKKQKPS